MEHHAYFLASTDTDLIKNKIQEDGVPLKGNPDLLFVEAETLHIDEVREAIAFASKEPFKNENTVVVLVAEKILNNAQNSLLKLFEDPPAHSVFYLCAPSIEIILPTLRSRLMELPITDTAQLENVEEFLSASSKGRQDMVKDIIENKDIVAARKLISGIEVALRQRGIESKENRETLHELALFNGYLYGASPSVKMILLHICEVV